MQALTVRLTDDEVKFLDALVKHYQRTVGADDPIFGAHVSRSTVIRHLIRMEKASGAHDKGDAKR